jgi:hypothetical protein
MINRVSAYKAPSYKGRKCRKYSDLCQGAWKGENYGRSSEPIGRRPKA